MRNVYTPTPLIFAVELWVQKISHAGVQEKVGHGHTSERGHFAVAESMLSQTEEVYRRTLGADHPDTIALH